MTTITTIRTEGLGNQQEQEKTLKGTNREKFKLKPRESN